MNLRSAVLFFSCAVLFPINVQAQLLKNLYYNLDRFLEFFTFGLIDIKDNDALEEIDGNLPGGPIFGGVCDRLKNIAIRRFAPENITEEVQTIIDSVKCGCDLIRLGGEVKFGCDFEEPVCVNLTDVINLDDLFAFDDEFYTDDSVNATDDSVNATDDGRRRLEDVSEDISFCATASIRADYNGRSPLTPLARETLKTSACAEILSYSIPDLISNFTGIPEDASIPKLCATVESNDGLRNLISLKSCDIFVVQPDDSIEACKKCDICGVDGLGVEFDCSNVNFFNSDQTNALLSLLYNQCFSAGAVPLSKLNDENFVYRPFLTPMP